MKSLKMKHPLFVISCFIILLLMTSRSPLLYGQDKGLETIIMPGAALEKLAGGFSFTEGPSADRKGNVYFTDQPNDRILLWDLKKGLSTFMQPSGRSNGLQFDSRGYLWSCADERNEIWKISPAKKIEKIIGSFNGKVFNGPNDLWICPSGGVYFTDPFYRRTWWDHTEMPQEKQMLFFLPDGSKNAVPVDTDLQQPNGIVGTADGKTLFVADIRARKTWKYEINSDGTLANKTLFCEMGSDGMTIDSDGNLYLTGNGVTVFDKNGRQIGNIAVPEKWTANVCFGGKDLKDLYITASTGLYRIKLKIRGTRG